MSSNTLKYLAHYAEPEARALETLLTKKLTSFSHCLAIAACGESTNLIHTLSTIPPASKGQVLVLVIINAHQNTPFHLRQANRWLLDHLANKYALIAKETNWLSRFSLAQGELWLVDNTTQARLLDQKEGVGKARKIVADLALLLWQHRLLASPFVHNTDADVTLPADYFSQSDILEQASKQNIIAAALYSFKHVFPLQGALLSNTLAYETKLRRYVNGLKRANSPYAYHSIGSTLLINLESYAAVRGFPKRAAGEDFYLLNKLAKVGRFIELQGRAIEINARLSERTAFGTGQAVGRVVSNKAEDYPVYHPQIFAVLKTFLQCMQPWLAQKAPLALKAHLKNTFKEAQHLPPNYLNTLVEVIEKALLHAPANEKGRIKAFHDAFDAFRTLKFVHALRDTGYADIPLKQIIDGNAAEVHPDRAQSLQSHH